MAVPKQRKTKSRVNQRRMHQFIETKILIKCKKCGKPALPHIVCKNCGFYKGQEVINVLKKDDKKEQKRKAVVEKSEKEDKLSMDNLSKK
jgi:large subunit ribosomal protein L32